MRKDTPEYIIELSKQFRKIQTVAENMLWQQLRGNKLKGIKFRRQYIIPLNKFVFFANLFAESK